jgi:hypothetical protein
MDEASNCMWQAYSLKVGCGSVDFQKCSLLTVARRSSRFPNFSTGF